VDVANSARRIFPPDTGKNPLGKTFPMWEVKTNPLPSFNPRGARLTPSPPKAAGNACAAGTNLRAFTMPAFSSSTRRVGWKWPQEESRDLRPLFSPPPVSWADA
jgi:hypothetical protein